MIKEIQLSIDIHLANDMNLLKKRAATICKVAENRIQDVVIKRRSIDGRHRPPQLVYQVAVYIDEPFKPDSKIQPTYQQSVSDRKVIIIGAGPAGYFAALECLEYGITPIVFERGKDVQSRRKDIRLLLRQSLVNPNSNYCFGEGGAGAYSDGKLYTRATKRGNVEKMLTILVNHGAHPDILIDAHPHIGSNRLPKIIKNIRQTILDHGGEVHFNAALTDLIIQQNQIRGVIINKQSEYLADSVILATGHSARDVYELLKSRNIRLEAKDFAVGVRVEHPQELINQIQYGKNHDHLLPAASYRLACQVGQRGVFSFCMCPGGWIIPASTAPGELVLNGMSLAKRNNPYANSGIVVTVNWDDLKTYHVHGIFAGLEFQRDLERRTFAANGQGSQQAPAQRMVDFVSQKISDLGPTSYIPGIHSVQLDELLPLDLIAAPLRQAFPVFGQKMKGYYTNEAQLLAVESRTSAPLRIPRDSSTLMHPDIQGLYPCGEGAGYAGGIVSAALDGQRVSQVLAQRLGIHQP